MTTRGLGDTNSLNRTSRRLPPVIPAAAPTGDDDVDLPAPAPAVPAPKTSSKRIKDGQTQLSAYVDIAISEEARDAIMYLANQPEGPVNLSDLVNQVLHPRGRPAPHRTPRRQTVPQAPPATARRSPHLTWSATRRGTRRAHHPRRRAARSGVDRRHRAAPRPAAARHR